MQRPIALVFLVVLVAAAACTASTDLTDQDLAMVTGGCSRWRCDDIMACNHDSVDCTNFENQGEVCFNCRTSIQLKEPVHRRCTAIADGKYTSCYSMIESGGCHYKIYGLCQLQACNTTGSEPSSDPCGNLGLPSVGPTDRRGCYTNEGWK